MRRLFTAGLLVFSTADVAKAQIGFQELRAADGTTYQVIFATSPLGGGAERLRITTVAGSVAGGTGCTTPGNVANDPVSAAGGIVSPGMQLYPYDLVRRTSIIVPPNSTMSFDGTFGGRVTFGTAGDPTARLVCGAAFDCIGQTGVVEALHPLDFAGDTIPAACIANDIDPDCNANPLTTFGFGVAASGTPPVCTNPDADVTVNTTLCAPEPSDGFAINAGQAVVFVYNHTLGMSGFTVDAGGFGISTDNINNPNCMNPPAVVSSSGRTDSQPAPPPPTSTPTNTPTITPTNTPVNTATSTNTPANTATSTNTPANTATSTNTPANTATSTNTPANTATSTNTPTNASTPTSTPTERPAAEEICRTKGFWKTHGCPQSGCEKAGSSNITQAVIDAAGGSIMVCGETLTNTDLNDAMSALEALCGQGGGITQLTSQLTAAALNCVITNGNADCAEVSIFETFAACNAACAAGQTTATVDGVAIGCIDAIDAFNSNPECEAQPLCNRDVGVCFNDPRAAGSANACNAAAKNSCTIFSGSPPCAP